MTSCYLPPYMAHSIIIRPKMPGFIRTDNIGHQGNEAFKRSWPSVRWLVYSQLRESIACFPKAHAPWFRPESWCLSLTCPRKTTDFDVLLDDRNPHLKNMIRWPWIPCRKDVIAWRLKQHSPALPGQTRILIQWCQQNYSGRWLYSRGENQPEGITLLSPVWTESLFHTITITAFGGRPKEYVTNLKTCCPWAIGKLNTTI